jgi:hypothetical protein
MLLNVRLTKEEDRIVKGLRRAKVNVSELVRRALRQAAASKSKVKRSAVLEEIIDTYPGPGAPSSRPALDDRRALSAFIANKVSRGSKRR